MNHTNLKLFSTPQHKILTEKNILWLAAILLTVILPLLIIPAAWICIQFLTRIGEARSVVVDVNNSWGLLEDRAIQIERSLRDWSTREQLYQYIQNPDLTFLEAFLTSVPMSQIGIDSVIVLDNGGQMIASRTIDISSGEEIPLWFHLPDVLEAYPEILDRGRGMGSPIHLIVIDNHVVIAASHAISDQNPTDPPMGTMIFLLFITPEEEKELSILAQKEITLHVIDQTEWLEFTATASNVSNWLVNDPIMTLLQQNASYSTEFPQTLGFASEGNIYTRILDRNTIAGYLRSREDHQQYVLFQVNNTRSLYLLGNRIGILFSLLVELFALCVFIFVRPLIKAIVHSYKRNRDYLERIQSIMRQINEILLMVDPSLTILDASPLACKLLRIPDAAIENEGGAVKLNDVLHLTVALDPHLLDDLCATDRVIVSRGVLQDGQEHIFEINANRVHDLDADAYMLILRDVTNRIENERALRSSEERYTLAARGANDGIWDWDLQKNELFCSLRWKEILGYQDHEIGSSPDEWMSRVHPEDRMNLQTQLSEHMRQRTKNFICEHRLQKANGEYCWVRARGLAVWNEEGYAYRIAGSMTDISEQKKIEEQLRHDALHDRLTGLGNRVLLLDHLRHANERKKRRPESFFAVFILGLDRFQQVNDTLGHPAGDQVLKTCATRLQTHLRAVDSVSRFTGDETLARMAGDEFVLLVEDLMSPEQSQDIAERLIHVITQPLIIDRREIRLSASVGIVVPEKEYTNPEEIIRDADIARYHAKRKGTGSYAVFDNQMYERTLSRMEIESSLRLAVERGEFEVYYQPIYSLKGDNLAGFEALLRWNHPQHGLLFPGDFIEIAEETGLIVPIGNFVLEQSCRQMVAWQAEFAPANPWVISVNLSPQQLNKKNLVEQVKGILEKTQMNPHHLWFEVTENDIMRNLAEVRVQLEHFRSLGIKIKIDDFGTGYSSLSYLKDLPIDGFKIDRSFIHELDIGNQQIVRSMMSLGLELGLVRVAEGVETESQRELMRTMNCDYVQGYLFSRPVPAGVATDLIRKSLAG